jgi:hypothetical protein
LCPACPICPGFLSAIRKWRIYTRIVDPGHHGHHGHTQLYSKLYILEQHPTNSSKIITMLLFWNHLPQTFDLLLEKMGKEIIQKKRKKNHEKP